MSGELNMSILLRFMADQARSGMAATTKDLQGIGSAAEEAGRKATASAGAMNQAAAAPKVMADAQKVLSTAIQETVGQSINMTAQLGRNATAMAGAIDAGSGLTRNMRDRIEAMRTEQREAANLQAHLDGIRARFNPLFAASQQYAQELRDIADAERMGAISAQEAAAARDRAAQAMAPMNNAMQGNARATGAATAANANLFAQWNDIAVMMAAGQNPMQLAMQQGTQVSQVLASLGGGTTALKAVGTSFLAMLNPISLATIGIIAFGAAGIQWLMKLGGESKSFEDNLKDLNATLGRMRTNLDLLGTVRLENTFGSLTGSVRGLAQGMLELDRASELKQFGAVIDGFLEKEVKVPFWSWDNFSLGMAMGAAPIPGMTTEDYLNNTPGREKRYSELGAANSFEDFEKRMADIKALAEAGNIDGVAAALQELQSAMAGGGSYTGMKDELRELLAELAKTGIETARLEAIWNGSAQATALTHQIDQMVRGYTQQAELAEASFRFGENSVQVEELRNQHARSALQIRLEELGVEAGSAEAKRANAALEASLAQDSAVRVEERRKAEGQLFTDLTRQSEISSAILLHGENSAEVEEIRNRHAREILEARLGEQNVSQALIDLAVELTREEQKRVREIREAAAQKKADSTLAELREEAAVQAAILEHGENSVQVKELQIAAERRAFEQMLLTLEVTEEVKKEMRAAWEAARGLASVDPFGTIAAGRDFARDQRQQLERLQLDASLIGATEAAKRRAIALYEAEIKIRELGLDIGSKEAAQIRENAALMAEKRIVIDQTTAAWTRLRDQQDEMSRLQLDASLVGATDAAKARAIALFEAERDIRQMGLDIGSKEADQIRQNAVLMAEKNREIERMADAWSKVRSSAEAAIDGPIDSLLKGDFKGALSTLINEINAIWTEFAIKNPIKNMILGTDYATMSDLGGIGGIFAQLFGGGDPKSSITASTMSAANMAVTAQMVTLNAGGIAGLPGIAGTMTGGAAGAGGAVSLGGSGNVQQAVWSFFAGKGLQSHQIAAIMGNISAESGFNPLAVGDGGTSFGLFQHHAGRGQGLLNHVGGMAGLGNVQAQLEYMWQEMLTGENGVLKRLMASTNVYDATKAFVGFERPAGWSAANPQGAMHWDKRLGAAEAAMRQFETATLGAGQNLGQFGTGAAQLGTGAGQLGSGLQNLGTSLSGLLGGLGANFGPGGQLIGGLLGSVLDGLGFALPFATGGHVTGPGGPREDKIPAWLSNGEYVINAAATAQNLSLVEAINAGASVDQLLAIIGGSRRPFADGGHVTGGASPLRRMGGASRDEMGGKSNVSVDVRTYFDRKTMSFESEVMRISQNVSERVTGAAFDEYDRYVLPDRVQHISNNPRERG